ncbi:MAG: hypothetical protein GY788_08485 [bacterium]|nr:hypothetical protein [bacterium]
MDGTLDDSAAKLAANFRRVLIGSYPLGTGFLFDDREAEKGKCEPLSKIEALATASAHNMERILRYVGGSDLTSSPRQDASRFIIDFRDLPLRRDAQLSPWKTSSVDEKKAYLKSGIVPPDYPQAVCADWPELLAIVERLVRPEREVQGDIAAKSKWWKFKRPNMRLYSEIRGLDFVVARSLTSAHFPTFARIHTDQIFDQTVLIFLGSTNVTLALLCSRMHEAWVNFFSGTLKDDGRYNIEDCFYTFPFAHRSDVDLKLQKAGQNYDGHRSQLMIERDEGLTKTYNRFHNIRETAPDIVALRELHAQMDSVVLRAYGWEDLAGAAAPEFIEQEADDGKQAKTRLDWPDSFKEEVLARLLALNAERAAEEREAGVATFTGKRQYSEEDAE